MLNDGQLEKKEPIEKFVAFIPQRLSLGFWITALAYTAFVAFVPLFLLFDLLQEAWRAGRLQNSSLPEFLALLVIIVVLLSVCWGFGRYFFDRWHMARMDEFWARRDGEYSCGIALGETGVSVQLFDEQFYVSRSDFRQFALYHKPARYGEVPYLQLHYLEHGSHKTKEFYWNSLLWSKMTWHPDLDLNRQNTQQEKQLVKQLNKLLE